jgi:hypothetical protein
MFSICRSIARSAAEAIIYFAIPSRGMAVASNPVIQQQQQPGVGINFAMCVQLSVALSAALLFSKWPPYHTWFAVAAVLPPLFCCCCCASPLQRLGAPVRNGLKLMCVGIGASFVGVAVTNTLIALRQALDPSFIPLNQAQNVLATSAAYGLYMATSSNIRSVAGAKGERGGVQAG